MPNSSVFIYLVSNRKFYLANFFAVKLKALGVYLAYPAENCNLVHSYFILIVKLSLTGLSLIYLSYTPG